MEGKGSENGSLQTGLLGYAVKRQKGTGEAGPDSIPATYGASPRTSHRSSILIVEFCYLLIFLRFALTWADGTIDYGSALASHDVPLTRVCSTWTPYGLILRIGEHGSL